MLQLSSVERRALRARAHNLDPVVSIAENGLTDAVLKEIEVSLGKLLVVYRPAPTRTVAVNATKSAKTRRPAAPPRKSKRSFQG